MESACKRFLKDFKSKFFVHQIRSDKMILEKENICTAEQKRKAWGDGEWCNEPDIMRFEHAGLKCIIVRNIYNIHGVGLGSGHLCGYCILEAGHPFYGKEKFDEFIEFDVHGGITYCKFENGVFKVGFDCSHSGDIIPCVQNWVKRKLLEPTIFDETYKNIIYCIDECKSLAEQLQGIKNG